MKKFSYYKSEYNLPFDNLEQAIDFVTNEIDFEAAYKRFAIENADCRISFKHPDMVASVILEYLSDEDFPNYLSHGKIIDLKNFIHDVMFEADFSKIDRAYVIPSYNEIKNNELKITN